MNDPVTALTKGLSKVIEDVKGSINSNSTVFASAVALGIASTYIVSKACKSTYMYYIENHQDSVNCEEAKPCKYIGKIDQGQQESQGLDSALSQDVVRSGPDVEVTITKDTVRIRKIT